MCASVEVEDDGTADSDDGSTGGGRRDRNSTSGKKTVAPLKIKINKKKKKRRGSDVCEILWLHFWAVCIKQ